MPFDAMAETPDEELLMRYAEGDAAAARALTARLAPLAYRLALRMTGDRSEAEDVTQEAMLRLWRVAPRWEAGRAQVSTWLYRVVGNLCTDQFRRRRTIALDAVPEPADEAAGPLAGLIAADRAQALEAALAALPDRQRQAVILRHIEALSNPEIAAIMEIGVEAVESLTARGKRALASALAGRRRELGFDDE